MLALSVRQPYAELILRGIKTTEFRSRATAIVGQRFWIYAAKTWAGVGGADLGTPGAPVKRGKKIVADNLVIAAPPPWMVELATALKLFPKDLPTGVIVGSAVIERVDEPSIESGGMFRWRLTEVKRATELRKPERRPQPVWFRPFTEDMDSK